MHAVEGELSRTRGTSGERSAALPIARPLGPLLLAAIACGAGAGGESATEAPAPRLLEARVVAAYPHDPEAWTQGLLWHEGSLYESVGRYGRSELRRVVLRTGEVEQQVRLPDDLFGEGLALVDDVLWQLTWRAGRALRWDLGSFSPLEERRYQGQGWGLCAAGGELVRSDGSSRLTFHRADDFRPVRSLEIVRQGVPQTNLNELECVDGWIYANVWTTEEIVRIDPASGRVTAVIDATGLLSGEEQAKAEVLNGIAYYPPNQTFLVTGKLWPKLFEVTFGGKVDP